MTLGEALAVLSQALGGDELAEQAFSDIIKEEGFEKEGEKLHRLLSVLEYLPKRLASLRANRGFNSIEEYPLEDREVMTELDGQISEIEFVMDYLDIPYDSRAKLLKRARLNRAGDEFSGHGFWPKVIKDTGQWEVEGDEVSRVIFYENGDYPSIKGRFTVRFEENSDTVLVVETE